LGYGKTDHSGLSLTAMRKGGISAYASTFSRKGGISSYDSTFYSSIPSHTFTTFGKIFDQQ